MGTVAATAGSNARTRSYFYVWVAAYCGFLAFGGFTPTYFVPIAVGSLREVSTVVHIHGLLFFCWTLMLLAQTWLVAEGKTTNHRSLGLLGISLATAMVITGLVVSLRFNGGQILRGVTDPGYDGLLNGWSSMLLFAIFFTLAIKNISRSDSHKRYMVLATAAILSAAVSRLYLPLFDFQPVPRWLVSLTIDSILVACLVNDWRTLGRFHFATVVGSVAIVCRQLFRGELSTTDSWRAIADLLLRITV